MINYCTVANTHEDALIRLGPTASVPHGGSKGFCQGRNPQNDGRHGKKRYTVLVDAVLLAPPRVRLIGMFCEGKKRNKILAYIATKDT